MTRLEDDPMSSDDEDEEDEDSDSDERQDRYSRSARPGSRRRKAKGLPDTDEEYVKRLEDVIASWDTLGAQKQEVWMMKATHDVLKRAVDHRYLKKHGMMDSINKDGDPIKRVPRLWDAAVRMKAQQLYLEDGFRRSTVISPKQVEDETPGYMLRQGMHKMQLRPEEEEELGLELIGTGHVYNLTPLNTNSFAVIAPRRDFGYGIYCKTNLLKRSFARRYALLEPHSVLANPYIYDDIILHAPTVELTAMIYVARDLPVKDMHAKYFEELKARMPELSEPSTARPIDAPQAKGDSASETPPTKELQNSKGSVQKSRYGPCTKKDYRELENLEAFFSPAALKGKKIASPDGTKLLAHSLIFITVSPKGHLSLEAQSPGTLAEQTPVMLGHISSRHVTNAVMSSFVGPKAIDPVCSIDTAACVLHFANGFTLDDNPANSNQFMRGHQEKVVRMEPSIDLFKLPYTDHTEKAPLLVDSVRDLMKKSDYLAKYIEERDMQ